MLRPGTTMSRYMVPSARSATLPVTILCNSIGLITSVNTVPHVYVSNCLRHWLKYWLVVYSAPNHYPAVLVDCQNISQDRNSIQCAWSFPVLRGCVFVSPYFFIHFPLCSSFTHRMYCILSAAFAIITVQSTCHVNYSLTTMETLHMVELFTCFVYSLATDANLANSFETLSPADWYPSRKWKRATHCVYIYIYIWRGTVFDPWLTHLSLVPHTCVTELGQHCFRCCPVACLAPLPEPIPTYCQSGN